MSTYTCMTLGTWIAALEALPSEMSIVLDLDGPDNAVGELTSWRGVYAHLAIDPAKHGTAYALKTVADALKNALAADGGTFEGYKGGEFRMDRNTPLWVSPYGDADEVRPIGIEVVERDGIEIAEVLTVSDAYAY
jgi:hypothetical protein